MKASLARCFFHTRHTEGVRLSNLPLRRGTTKWRRQHRDWPDKKDSRRKDETMLEWLKEILGDAWTDEIDKAVSARCRSKLSEGHFKIG